MVKSYIKFLLASTNQHGVHSPFVYNLVTKCFYDNKSYDAYTDLKKYRKYLKNNHNTIKVEDFGAGSRVFNSDVRKISAIAKNAGISSKRSKLLYRLIGYFKPNSILEIGTSLGLATSALSYSNGDVITLEGCGQTQNVPKKSYFFSSKKNVDFITTEFSQYLNNIENKTFDLIYFDGNHSKEATLQYFNALLKTAHNDSVWIFDDIHWSNDMEEAWVEIKNNSAVTVTIDTFQWGFVFFRKEQEKEHFIIRV